MPEKFALLALKACCQFSKQVPFKFVLVCSLHVTICSHPPLSERKILCKFDGPNPKMWQLDCTNGRIVEREMYKVL